MKHLFKIFSILTLTFFMFSCENNFDSVNEEVEDRLVDVPHDFSMTRNPGIMIDLPVGTNLVISSDSEYENVLMFGKVEKLLQTNFLLDHSISEIFVAAELDGKYASKRYSVSEEDIKLITKHFSFSDNARFNFGSIFNRFNFGNITFYFPGRNRYSSIIFEDNWPNKGDYDFNDLKIDLNLAFQPFSNRITVKGVYAFNGGRYDNGFGVRLTNGPVNVLSSSDDFGGLLERMGPNTFSFFENGNSILSYNTEGTDEFSATFQMSSFAWPIDFFLYNKDRDTEIHLPAFGMTSIASPATIAKLGTMDDDSGSLQHLNFLDSQGMPWAMLVPVRLELPEQGQPIYEKYPKFMRWANRLDQYLDWWNR